LLDRYRLVTVTGPGGVGKTRLAAEVATTVADQFADGVQLVELAAIQDQAMVPTAVAAVLGIQQVPWDAGHGITSGRAGPPADATGAGQLRACARRSR
jgi:predicted ATPase